MVRIAEIEQIHIQRGKEAFGWKGGIDGYLKQNLDMALEVIKKDWDMIFCIDGYEGVGKSAFAQQIAFYVDRSFNIDRICFTPKEFIQSINKAEKYQAIVYDEAYGGMSSRSAMSEVNKMLMGVLAEIRQKNLWVFIILPCFFELDKYCAVWRSRALLHCYTGKNFERGFFSFYSQNGKKALYVNGKKYLSYAKISPSFTGRFPKGYVVPESEYRQKKLEALNAREEKKKKEPKEDETMIKKRMVELKKGNPTWSAKVIADYMLNKYGITRSAWFVGKAIKEETGVSIVQLRRGLENKSS